MTNTNKKRFIYIYNLEQANFYVTQNVRILQTGVHPKTKRTWFKFDYNETNEAYKLWCSRSNT